MRSPRAAVAAIAVLCLSAVGGAHPTPPAPTHDDSQELLANERDWAKAAVDGDADRMAGYMTEDYLEAAWQPAAENAPAHWTTLGKTEWVEGIRKHKDVYTSVDLRNLTVHVQGDLAIVTGEYSQKGTTNGKDNSSSGIYANTWTKRSGRWLIAHSVFP
jgi:ketosteroid isomerase-like protein